MRSPRGVDTQYLHVLDILTTTNTKYLTFIWQHTVYVIFRTNKPEYTIRGKNIGKTSCTCRAQ